MNLQKLKSIFLEYDCKQVYVKTLAANDNSKNQVYFGGSFDILNILPIHDIKTVEAGKWSKERFKASLYFQWISEDGTLSPAPNAQLILYPKYPEVRFSGFLLGAKNAPSKLMHERKEGRLLFFSVSNQGGVLGFVSDPDSEIAREFGEQGELEKHGVFSILDLSGESGNRNILLRELLRINSKGWITSKRLDSRGNVLPCNSPNCGGYTLEAELQITPNGYSEPDFMGWEIKQYGVNDLTKPNLSKAITLMTPEPTDGLYQSKGADFFIRTYGYPDKNGKPDRLNFGGIHRAGEVHPSTKLKMVLVGFDPRIDKIRNTNGRIALIDGKDYEAASWSFTSMLLHWNRKHARACYIPSLSDTSNGRKYWYGNRVILGVGTDFNLFLSQVAKGNIYYDPGIKLENMSTNPKIKKRSQFRIKLENLPQLYHKNEIIDVQEWGEG